MRLSKKGDLAISTNAIVILIIAVIMLGLIIGFVTKGFGAVSKKFFNEADKITDPQQPSGVKLITTSPEQISVTQGDYIKMKIGVYNKGTADSSVKVQPKLDCGSRTLLVPNTAQANPQTIPAKSSIIYTFIMQTDKNAQLGQTLCQISVVDASGSAVTDAGLKDISADLLVEVTA